MTRRTQPAVETAGPYSIGSTHWPGLSKLIEECGEVVQVAGKLLGTGGQAAHWDGTDLSERMEEELGDLLAALTFVIDNCGLDASAVVARSKAKRALFDRWHAEGDPPPFASDVVDAVVGTPNAE